MLDDLKAVTVDYLGGVVVGKLGGSGQGQDWLPLDKWTTLDEQTLCHKRGRPGFTMRSRASDWCSRGSQASGGPPFSPPLKKRDPPLIGDPKSWTPQGPPLGF